jgi:hypothetical protein
MVSGNAVRTGTVILITLSVALWFAATPVAAQQEQEDGGLGVDVGTDGVQVGGENGVNISNTIGSSGSIDDGGGGGAVKVSAGGGDGFTGGGGGSVSAGTDGVDVSTTGGGGDAQGNVKSSYEASLDADTDGNVSGTVGGTLEAAGQGGTVKCSFDSADGQPSPDDCQTPGTGGGVPSPGLPGLDELPGGVPSPEAPSSLLGL